MTLERRNTGSEIFAAEEVNNQSDSWSSYTSRYRHGEWRAPIFRDMILADARTLGDDLTFLDIGCGQGFDGSLPMQISLAETSGRYIGIEPDPNVSPGSHVDDVHCCTLEDAPLEAGSIDLAFAVMVLEHIQNPESFWRKLHKCLAEGGIFWGFTMDARHIFCTVSRWSEALGAKNMYLNVLRGRRGVQRYENFPTCYRANTPEQIETHTHQFAKRDFINFFRVSELDYYVPRPLRPLSHALAWMRMVVGRPGSILAVRLEK